LIGVAIFSMRDLVASPARRLVRRLTHPFDSDRSRLLRQRRSCVWLGGGGADPEELE
jgi:hypothetical protein